MPEKTRKTILGDVHKECVCCDCGKLVAKRRGKRIYLWCKNCKKEIEIDIL